MNLILEHFNRALDVRFDSTHLAHYFNVTASPLLEPVPSEGAPGYSAGETRRDRFSHARTVIQGGANAPLQRLVKSFQQAQLGRRTIRSAHMREKPSNMFLKPTCHETRFAIRHQQRNLFKSIMQSLCLSSRHV